MPNDPRGFTDPIAADDLPELVTSERICTLTGISRAAFTRWGLTPVDRRHLSDDELRPFGEPCRQRLRVNPKLYRKDDVMPYVERYLRAEQGRLDAAGALPYAVVFDLVVKGGGFYRRKVQRAKATWETWASRHSLHIGKCTYRDGTITVWAARWDADQRRHYGWYRREKSRTVWRGTILREETVPLDGLFIPLKGEWDDA